MGGDRELAGSMCLHSHLLSQKVQLPAAPRRYALTAKSALAQGQRDSEAEELRILAGRLGGPDNTSETLAC